MFRSRHHLPVSQSSKDLGPLRRSKTYFAKNFWVSFWFENYAPQHMLDDIGIDWVMFGLEF